MITKVLQEAQRQILDIWATRVVNTIIPGQWIMVRKHDKHILGPRWEDWRTNHKQRQNKRRILIITRISPIVRIKIKTSGRILCYILIMLNSSLHICPSFFLFVSCWQTRLFEGACERKP